MERRSAERIIIFVYTIYALAFMFASTILGWPGWITPVTSVGVLTVWIIYLRELKDYRIRSLLYSGVVLATFVLYTDESADVISFEAEGEVRMDVEKYDLVFDEERSNEAL